MAGSPVKEGEDVIGDDEMAQKILINLVRSGEAEPVFLLDVHQALLDPAKRRLLRLIIGCTSSEWIDRMIELAQPECTCRAANCAELSRLMGIAGLPCGRTLKELGLEDRSVK